jgi:hypothetical protein
MDGFMMKDRRIASFARFEASLYMNYYVLYMEELYLYRHLSRYIYGTYDAVKVHVESENVGAFLRCIDAYTLLYQFVR